MYYNVGVAASSDEDVKSELKYAVEEFLDTLAPYKHHIRFILGGYWGLMKFFANHASKHGFTVVFILPEIPREKPPRIKEYIILHTDLGYEARSVLLASSSDVLVCLGGRVGSMIEVMLAYSFGKPTIVLTGYSMDTDRFEKSFGMYIDRRKTAKLYYAHKGSDVAYKLIEILNLDQQK